MIFIVSADLQASVNIFDANYCLSSFTKLPDASRKAFAAKHSGLGRRALPRPCSGRSSPPRLDIKVVMVMVVRSAIRVFLTSKRVFETLIPSGL